MFLIWCLTRSKEELWWCRLYSVLSFGLLFREVAQKNINIDPMAENIIKLHICCSEHNWKGRVLNIKVFPSSLFSSQTSSQEKETSWRCWVSIEYDSMMSCSTNYSTYLTIITEILCAGWAGLGTSSPGQTISNKSHLVRVRSNTVIRTSPPAPHPADILH